MNAESLSVAGPLSEKRLNPLSKIRIASYLMSIPTTGTLIQAGNHFMNGDRAYSALGLGVAGFYAATGTGIYLLDRWNQTRSITMKDFLWPDKPKQVKPEKLDYEIWNEPYNEPHQVHDLYPGYETYLGDYKLNQLG